MNIIAYRGKTVFCYSLHIAGTTQIAADRIFNVLSAPVLVGYAQNTLDDNGGAVMTGAQFLNCNDSGNIALSSIKPAAAAMSAEDLAGSVEIQTLDNAGLTVDSYVWNGAGWEGDDETTFAPGTGLWVFNQVGDADIVSLQTAGKVGTADIVVTLDDNGGAVGIANPFPVKVALADLIPECASMTAADLAGCVEIQTLDNAGLTVDSYVWNGEGWEGDDNTEFAAGAGLWVFNQIGDAAEVTLRIPAPEL